MNDKFWDLKKVKQDRIINAGLKIFAENGYRHASTDEIAAEAAISKGLLFHYFYSKIGLYGFLCEYSGRFALLEINSELRKKSKLIYFELHRDLLRAQGRVMRQYPYMLLFLDAAAHELSKEAAQAAAGNERMAADRCAQLLEQAERPDRLSASDTECLSHMISLVAKDTAARLLTEGAFTPDRFTAEVGAYVNLIENLVVM